MTRLTGGRRRLGYGALMPARSEQALTYPSRMRQRPVRELLSVAVGLTRVQVGLEIRTVVAARPA